jgi:histidinol-phosphate aminotransferase
MIGVISNPLPGEKDPRMPPRTVHGGIKPAELQALGIDPIDALDFSASISPIGPPEGVRDAIAQVDLATYPDPQCLRLRESLAKHLSLPGGGSGKISPENLLVGNGSTEIIHLLARACLSKETGGTAGGETGPTAFILTPTYGEYAGACLIQKAPVLTQDAGPSPDFRWDLDRAAQTIESRRPALVFLCNPNNPTGVYLSFDEVQALAQSAAHNGGILVLDEAYTAFVASAWNTLENTLRLLDLGNVVILRSMTKSHALTSLRAGYSIAPEALTALLASYQPDWSVNGLAQAAAEAALDDPGYASRSLDEVAGAKRFLIESLIDLGFNVPPAAANFLLVRVKDAPGWRDRLASRGMFVRDCTSFGLPDFIRVGVRQIADCQRLVEVIKALI